MCSRYQRRHKRFNECGGAGRWMLGPQAGTRMRRVNICLRDGLREQVSMREHGLTVGAGCITHGIHDARLITPRRF
jgi:hypothetical protein